VVVQGCNNAPSYICNDSPSCAPIDTPINGFFTLDCPTNAFTTANGDWSFGQTIVFDRKSSLVSMPHPIVRVECQMQTRPGKNSILLFFFEFLLFIRENFRDKFQIIVFNNFLTVGIKPLKRPFKNHLKVAIIPRVTVLKIS
jgi:hypothetical protein